MPESLKTKFIRWKVNLYPFYRRTGARLTYISDDWKEMRVTLPFNWKTRNRVGTIFGGCISASVDPFYMFMLIKLLGKEYTVWDKASTTNFRKLAQSTLYATFSIDDEELETIRTELNDKPKINRTYTVHLKDKDGVVYATIEKVINIRRKKGLQ